jgi:drug/metabolite transporter (DMT)-like permease
MLQDSRFAPTFALVLTTLIWGSTFIITKDVVTQWTPLRYLAVRFIIAAIALALIFPSAVRKLNGEEWRAGAMLGALIGGGMLLQTAGQIYTTATKSAFITSLATPLVPVMAYAILRSRPSASNLAGIAVAFAGGMLMLLPHSLGDSGMPASGVNLGDALTVCCTIFFATHITLMERYLRRFDVSRLTVLQIAASAVLLMIAWACVKLAALIWTADELPAFIARETGVLVWSGKILWQFLYLAFVGTVAAFLLWAWGQRRVTAVRAAIIFTLEPIFAMLFAVVVRGREELLDGWAMAGAWLIVAGVLVSELRISTEQRRG